MATGQAQQPGMTWLVFALMTVASWGVYGVLLQKGAGAMGSHTDPNTRYKAFLFVGIAYFLTAVLAPLAVLMMNGASWKMPTAGMGWSLIAGVAGAAGAFCVLLAFGAYGSAAGVPVIMSIVFGGAPIVNALVAMLVAPPAGGIAAIKPPFWIGLILAASGGFLVTKFRPPPPVHKGPPAKTVAHEPK